ncbi:MAG: DedA family protein [Myxococcales bacterium]
MLENLIQQWGYLGVALGTLFEGEATVLAAGALAHKGLLRLPWVWLAAFVGTTLADQAWFWIGRRFGEDFLAKRPQLRARSERVGKWLDRFGALFVMNLRFLYGLRTASVIWLGSTGFSYRRFALLDTLGAALWSLVMGGVGWGLGATLKAVLGRAGHAHELLVLAALVGLVTFVLFRLRKTQRATETQVRT